MSAMRREMCLGMVGIMMSAGLIGCASDPAPADQGSRELTQGQRPAARTTQQRLYDAIVAETKARGWGIEVASEKYYLVNTEYETLNARFRKRRLMRVILLPRGGALRVKVEHERDVGTPEQPQWVLVEDAITNQREDKEELEIARAIEKRFHDSK